MLPPWMIDKLLQERAEREAQDRRVPLHREPPPPTSMYEDPLKEGAPETLPRGSYTF